MAVAKARVRDRIVRRQEILLAAGRVFLKKGFRLATMEDIAEAAGVGVGTLYHYFESKEHLFATLLAESTELLTERLRAAAAKQLPPGLGLLAINRAYVDYFAEYPEYFRIQMFFQHEDTGDPRFAGERQKIQRLGRENLELVAEKIRAGQEMGFYRRDVDPYAAATALWASYNGIFLLATNRPALEMAGLSVERLLSTAAYLHFTGLAADKSLAPHLPPATSQSPGTVSLSDLREVVQSAPWIEPDMIFSGMRMTFQSDRAKGVHEIYEWRLSGARGGTWTVTIDDGALEVKKGASDTPSVVFEISDENYIRLVTGLVEPTGLLMKGELKVSGNLQSAAMFRTFFLPAGPPG